MKPLFSLPFVFCVSSAVEQSVGSTVQWPNILSEDQMYGSGAGQDYQVDPRVFTI